MDNLQILCLHGYRGSAAVLRDQMRSWMMGLQRIADFVHVDAPSLAAGDFGWWHAGRRDDRGWARTRRWLETLRRQRCFDGVFGFSQGAALAALVVGMNALPVRFAILVGGFVSSEEEHAPCYAALRQSALPSLHITGRADRVVPSSASHALAACFRAPVVIEHDGGHIVAATPAIRAGTCGFLGDMLWPGRRDEPSETHYPGGAACTRRSDSSRTWPWCSPWRRSSPSSSG